MRESISVDIVEARPQRRCHTTRCSVLPPSLVPSSSSGVVLCLAGAWPLGAPGCIRGVNQ
jgi:hypothetical protein